MKHEQGLIQRLRRGAQSVRWCLGIVVTIGSAACAPSPEPAYQTVEYYRANLEARQARVAECAKDPAVLGKTPDCVNAKRAEELESIGSVRDLPPMQLDPKRDRPGSPASNDKEQPREVQ